MSGKKLTSFDGGKIYYDVTTKGSDWLIFIHGLGGDLTAWTNTRDYFHKKGYSTLALDLRGHGFSERKNNKAFYKFENCAKDVHLILKKEKIKNAIIVGHCFGAMIAVYLQSKYPSDSKGLVLVETSHKVPFIGNNFLAKVFLEEMTNLLLKVTPDIKRAGRANHSKFVGTSDFNLKRILSDILHTSLRSYLMVCNNLIMLNTENLLTNIYVPTLVIGGENDKVFPPAVVERFSKRIKNSQLNFIAGTNHVITLNNPKGLAKTIDNFLIKIDSTKKIKAITPLKSTASFIY